jgi:hypothetical protein
MNWLEPWWSTESFDEAFHDGFRKQLELEVGPDHPLWRIKTRLVARGLGDDALFAIQDGSGRVAAVHLTWSSSQQRMPWPETLIFESLKHFETECMLPDHRQWKSD